jgi:hypothetical protein
MKSKQKTLLVFSFIVPLLVLASGCRDSSPPSPTSTPSPTVTSTPSPTPTLSAPPAATGKNFHGDVQWDYAVVGYRDDNRLIARIGDTICGESTLSDLNEYDLTVASVQEKPGCGREGDIVRFFVGDERAIQAAVWHEDATPQSLGLWLGGPKAIFLGKANRGKYGDVVPYVGDIACGGTPIKGPLMRANDYWVVVFSDEQKPGCGREGSIVTFNLVDSNGFPVAAAAEHGVWHAGNFPDFNLTFPPAN